MWASRLREWALSPPSGSRARTPATTRSQRGASNGYSSAMDSPVRCSSAARSRALARERRCFTLSGVSPSASATSAVESCWTSRRTKTDRCDSGERVHQLLEQVIQLRAGQPLLGVGSAALSHVRLLLQRVRRHAWPAAVAPEPLERLVQTDPQEPGGEPCAAGELRELAEGEHVRLLHQLLGRVLVANHRANRPVQARVVPAHQQLEARALTGDDARHEGLVRDVGGGGWRQDWLGHGQPGIGCPGSATVTRPWGPTNVSAAVTSGALRHPRGNRRNHG